MVELAPEEEFKMSLIMAIAEAAEKVGGVSNLIMIPGRKKWSDHVVGGYLWYNFLLPNGLPSTGAVQLKGSEN